MLERIFRTDDDWAPSDWIILLVVVAHMVSTIRTQTSFGWGLYVFIYLFHMPAMIGLAGLFSKADATT